MIYMLAKPHCTDCIIFIQNLESTSTENFHMVRRQWIFFFLGIDVASSYNVICNCCEKRTIVSSQYQNLDSYKLK